MAGKYSQISYGSSGDDVKTLQELLNSSGYNLDVDGQFGQKTQQAVKDYQAKNNLTVDGIVGNNTWSSLTGFKPGANASTMGSSSGAQTATSDGGGSDGFQYGEYQESDAVQQAYALLQQQMANKPGEYTSAWSDQINAILDQIMNREKFSYDLNADALYQQYADQYTQMGKMAMMDTMGQAAAMTGGYGNSYAQSVGQQAYQGYLQQLNEVVPELYGMALDQYNQEGQNMLNQYSLLADQDQQDYGRYRDSVEDYYAQLQAAYDQYNTERDYDYSKWADGRDFAYGEYSDDRAYDYQTERDKVADEQWQKEYDEMVRQYDQNYALSAGKSSGGSSSGGSGSKKGTGGGGYDNAGYKESVVKQAQAFVGASADGKWGSNSAAAAKKKGYNSLAEVVKAMGGDAGGGDDVGGVPTNYSELYAYLNDAVAAGFNKNEISLTIREAASAGIITQNQAQKLLGIFNPKNATY